MGYLYLFRVASNANKYASCVGYKRDTAAFASERRAASLLLPGARRCRSTSPARRAHSSKPTCGARWDIQTNERTGGHRIVTQTLPLTMRAVSIICGSNTSTLQTQYGILIIIHEYYYGGAVALLLQDHLTMSVKEQSQYLSATVQREHKTCPGVNPQGNTP